jgi:hypothetical protein
LPAALEQIRAGYAKLRAEGVAGPITERQAMTAGERVTAAAHAETVGMVLPEGGDQRSEEARSLRKLRGGSQQQRAQEAGVSRRTQQKLDRLARERPDLLEVICRR